MAVILDEFPHMAGTASSLAGTLRFGVGAPLTISSQMPMAN
jgi:DHA1 family bicyclomycin/chloramphenicol resistance-like MFS transporter